MEPSLVNLNQRDREILEILISDYIATAEPVGSRAVAKKCSGRLSPATVRNVTADLEELGLLTQPHTSAGRVPTTEGLRYFVDRLLEVHELSEDEQHLVRDHYHTDDEGAKTVFKKTSRILAIISNYTGLVVAPSFYDVLFKQIQFVELSKNRLLGIFVAQNGLVQNKILEIEEPLNFPELERINNYCNAAFYGLSLEEAREKIARELKEVEADYDRLLAKALLLSQKVFDEVPPADLLVDGEFRLLDNPEFSEVRSLKEVLKVLEEKNQIRRILDRCRESDGVRIFIGAEMGAETFVPTGVVSSNYKKNGRVLGTLGVIGPARMDYSRVIPAVDFTAKLLGDILDDNSSPL